MPVRGAFDHGDAHAHDGVRDRCPHGVDDQVHEAFGRGELVRAVVGDRRHELVDQVAVRAVDVDDVEAGLHGAAGRLGVGLHELMALGDGELPGNLAARRRARHR